MSRAASSSSGETKSFWRRPRLSSQCNASSANRFAGPTIRVAAPSSQMQPLTNRRLSSSPQQQSSDEEDEELRSFLTIREPIPRHSAGARRGRDESPSSPASSFDSTRLSPWSTPTSPRWSGSTTPPGSSSLEGHSPGLSTSLSSSPFSDASVVVSSDPRKNSRDGGPFAKCVSSSASTSSSPGCRVSLNGDQPPPPCNIWAGGFKWQDPPGAAHAKNRDECLQISDFWKYHHRRSSDVSSDADSRRGDDIDASFDGTRRASSFDALELDSDDSFVDAVRGARPKISLPVPKHSPPKNNFPEPQQPSYPGRSRQDSKEPCCHCKPSPNLMPLECCEQDARGQGDEPLGSGVGSRKGLNWPCTLQPPTQRCEDCLYSVPLSTGIQWVQASCGKFPWNRRRGSVGGSSIVCFSSGVGINAV
ncbi:hypothetical protein HPB48_005279 [Haemaphysalis longicornis]|uniref:Uncharacterized protein n=1 Tax=Haemaphysalis longicornis TaxID=44386 RepID=A0A9J6H4L4_HAELO|nr:hypothetical protein HPB48_005279 [Haemaphysalis longicornis]